MPIGEQPGKIEQEIPVEAVPPVQENQESEQLPDFSEFTEEKIANNDSAQNEVLQEREDRISGIEKQYSSSKEIFGKYQQRLDSVSQKIRDFTDETKKKIQGFIVGASMLIPAAGFAAEGTALEKQVQNPQASAKIEELQVEEGQQTELERAGVELVEKNKQEKTDKLKEHAAEVAENTRQELIEHYSSKEYLDGLTVEYGGKKERAKEVQSERIKNLETVEIDTSLSYKEFMDKMKSAKTNADGIKDVFLVAGYDNEKVVVPYDIDEKMKEARAYIDTLVMVDGIEITDEIKKLIKDELDISLKKMLLHELTHAATGKYGEMSKNAIGILKESYVPIGNELDKYLSHPLELLERKKALDRDMEELGIKKYGEEFTDEHYKKVIDAYEKGLFSKDAREFIIIIKQDPSVYGKIINGIAQRTVENNLKEIV